MRTAGAAAVIMRALRAGFGASPYALVLAFAGCNAITGLGQDFQEVDCFPPSARCVDGSVPRGPDGGPLLEGDGTDGTDNTDGTDAEVTEGSSPFTSDDGDDSPSPIDGSNVPDAEAGPVAPVCVPGGSCNAGDCQIGALVCSDGGLVCVSTGTVGNGIHCGTAGHVCSAGACVACAESVTCTGTPCHLAATSCTTGHSVCVDTSTLSDLTACGSAGMVCEQGSCVVEPKRYAFLSKGTFTASAGIGAADTMCNTEAKAGGLAGSYLAALSSTTASVASRFTASGPRWFLPNGTLLGDATLVFSALAPSIPLGADGVAHPADSGSSSITVWTGCGEGANAVTANTNENCSNWSTSSTSFRGTFGDALGGGAVAHTFGWGSTGCSPTYPVYCFQK